MGKTHKMCYDAYDFYRFMRMVSFSFNHSMAHHFVQVQRNSFIFKRCRYLSILTLLPYLIDTKAN